MSVVKTITDLAIFKQIQPSPLEDHHINHDKLIIHEDVIYYACGKDLRCSGINSLSYKLIDIASLDFPIKGLKINSLGSLLAVYGDSKILICTLPTSTSITTKNTDELSVRSFVIGKPTYSKCTILKVLWQKTSRYEASLVILSDDDVIRVFDPAISIDSPQMEYNLASLSNPYQIGLLDSSIEGAVSMSFGSDDTLSGMLSLYVLNTEGDIYCIYPFTSNSIVATKEAVSDLFNESALLSDTYYEDFTSHNREQAIEQLRFVTALWKQIPQAQQEIRNGTQHYVLHVSSPNASIQGPLAIQPYPRSLYEDYGVDIISTHCGENKLLVVSFKNGGYLVTLQDPELMMKWYLGDEDVQYTAPALTDLTTPTLSSVYYKKSVIKSPTYLKKSNKSSILYTETGSNVSKIDLTTWGKELSDLIDKGPLDTVSDLHTISIKPLITDLYKLESREVVRFIGFVDSFDTGPIVLIVSNSRVSVIEETSKEVESKPEQEKKAFHITPVLRGPYSEVDNLITESLDFIRPKASTSLLIGSGEILKDLNSCSSEVLGEVVLLHKISLNLNHRLVCQKEEEEQQVEVAADVSRSLERVQKYNTANIERLKSINERQSRLNERLSKLFQRIQTRYDLPITGKEKSWFKEIKELTYFFNSSLNKSGLLAEQLHYLKQEMSATQSSQAQHEADNFDFSKLNEILNKSKATLQ